MQPAMQCGRSCDQSRGEEIDTNYFPHYGRLRRTFRVRRVAIERLACPGCGENCQHYRLEA